MNSLKCSRIRARIVASLVMLLGSAGFCGDDGGSGNPSAVASYAVSGTISHLDSGSLSIRDGGETLMLSQGTTSFAFTKPLAKGTAYAVTVTTQPSGENCVVNNASGTINGAGITNISIVCNTFVSRPLAVGISAAKARIYLPVSQVGTASTTFNVMVDTGSPGTLLRASDIFPPSMVSTNGFVFPAGQTSISYKGITITNVVATRSFGGQSTDPTQEIGNLGFAQVTFGTGSQVTTAIMPILFVYQEQTKAGIAAPVDRGLSNLIGVNPSTDPIVVGGSPATSATMPCSPQSTTTCWLASPFRYLSYATDVDKGFVLHQVALAPCNIEVAGDCPTTPALTIGVTASIAAGFNTTGLSSCRSIVLMGTSSEPACSQVIPSVMISSGNSSFTGPEIFDSGQPKTLFEVPAGTNFPESLPAGSVVQFTTPSGFAYQYAVGTGFSTVINQGAGARNFTNSGIAFFTQNSLLIDYTKAIEGWRNGS